MEKVSPENLLNMKDLSYLMESKIELPMKDSAIFEDTSNTINKALEKTYKKNNNKKEICKTAFEIALNQLV